MGRQLPLSDKQLAAVCVAMAKVSARWRGHLLLVVVDELNGAEDPSDAEVERAIAEALERLGVSGEGDALLEIEDSPAVISLKTPEW